MIQLCHKIIYLLYSIHEELIIKIIVIEKIKTINNKFEQNKAQYDLDTKTAKISALSSGNVGRYEFQSGKDVSPENDVLEKVAKYSL